MPSNRPSQVPSKVQSDVPSADYFTKDPTCGDKCTVPRPSVDTYGSGFNDVIRYCYGNGATKCQYEGIINCWDVSKVTDMNKAFRNQYSFNEPLECRDVGKVGNMRSMFEYAFAFNQPLDSWNVGQVKTMFYMFYDAYR